MIAKKIAKSQCISFLKVSVSSKFRNQLIVLLSENQVNFEAYKF
jgi:hypothetical protein